jgi:hypothetical protein
MKYIIKLLAFSLLIQISFSCGKKDELKSDKAELFILDLEINASVFSTIINGTNISLIKDLPYGSSEVKVKTLSISEGAVSSISAGDTIQVSDMGIDISVTAQNEVVKKVFHLSFPVAAPSNKAALLNLGISYNGASYQAVINGLNVTVDKEFAYNASGNPAISSFTISENAHANITIGQEFDFDEMIPICITAEDGKTSKTYSLSVTKDTDGELLIEHSSYSSCTKSNTHRFEELMLENNLWNIDNLPPGSFSQCIYQYQNGISKLFGWEWSFTEDQHGVNAYPEVIYGLKPWYSPDGPTTKNLPRKINEISKLKVSYDIEKYIDDGEYNLAFDNWICSTSSSTPESILFEFMIWEDSQNLTTFGDYQGDITTSNGVYKFYKGEPDWEPPGCNWTYLAFVRVDKRSSGKVDFDELLDYLVNNGIVQSESYLSSIELGNEVGNSKGYTVFKSFVVEIE